MTSLMVSPKCECNEKEALRWFPRGEMMAARRRWPRKTDAISFFIKGIALLMLKCHRCQWACSSFFHDKTMYFMMEGH